jgi:hypothetical protein
MKSCCERQEGHSDCNSSDSTKVLPKRLVYIPERGHDYVQLVEIDHSTDITNRPYLILSYCWGQGNESARTTIENLESRLEKIPTTTLPRTIQDAIRLTKMMGFEYLWVDAMCILQRTNNNPGEFQTEAIKMRDYYANAECCISASLASDSSEGFLAERPLARFPIAPMHLKLSSPSQSQVVMAKERDWSRKGILYGTPLMQRGWYLQEYMLSKRILHWTLHGLFLQCQSSTFLEGRLERWKYSLFPKSFDLRAILSLRDDRIIAYDGWYQVLESVSQKALTYERDRMYAIHGVASLIIQRLQAEYILGVFRPTIAQGLAWSRASRNKRNLSKPLVPVETNFPAWCWASSCPIRYHEVDEKNIFILDDHPQRPLQFPTHPGDMSLKETSDSKLYIKAPLIRIGLSRKTEYKDGEFRVAVQDKRQRNLIELSSKCYLDCKKPSHGSFSALDTSTAVDLEQGIDVQFLLIAQSSRKNSPWPWYLGLLVRETGNMKEKTYQRYGFLKVQWESVGDEALSCSVADCYEGLEEIVLG